MSDQLRYSDEELEEFRQLILTKLDAATALYDELCDTLRSSGNDTADTAHSFNALEEGSGFDLIVVPNKKKNVFSRLFNPSLAHKILFAADIPMLVIPV